MLILNPLLDLCFWDIGVGYFIHFFKFKVGLFWDFWIGVVYNGGGFNSLLIIYVYMSVYVDINLLCIGYES